MNIVANPLDLRAQALACLLDNDPATKSRRVAALAQAWAEGGCTLDAAAVFTPLGAIPGRPGKPELVPPRLVGRRSMATAMSSSNYARSRPPPISARPSRRTCRIAKTPCA